MRNIVIPLIVLLPSLAGIAHAAQDRRAADLADRPSQQRSIAAQR